MAPVEEVVSVTLLVQWNGDIIDGDDDYFMFNLILVLLNLTVIGL